MKPRNFSNVITAVEKVFFAQSERYPKEDDLVLDVACRLIGQLPSTEAGNSKARIRREFRIDHKGRRHYFDLAILSDYGLDAECKSGLIGNHKKGDIECLLTEMKGKKQPLFEAVFEFALSRHGRGLKDPNKLMNHVREKADTDINKLITVLDSGLALSGYFQYLVRYEAENDEIKKYNAELDKLSESFRKKHPQLVVSIMLSNH